MTSTLNNLMETSKFKLRNSSPIWNLLTATVHNSLNLETQIIVSRNYIVLFGGLGCDKNLLWAKLNTADEKWYFP